MISTTTDLQRTVISKKWHILERLGIYLLLTNKLKSSYIQK